MKGHPVGDLGIGFVTDFNVTLLIGNLKEFGRPDQWCRNPGVSVRPKKRVGFRFGASQFDLPPLEIPKDLIATDVSGVGYSDSVIEQLTMPSLEDDGGYLSGDTRMTVSPDADDLADARLDGFPDARLTNLLSGLCAISRAFDIDWEEAHDYGELGFIRFGEADAEQRQFCEGFNEMFEGAMGDIDPSDFDLPDL